MTNLTDRYVYATTRSLPPPRRADIADELLSSIGDQVEERVAAGADPEVAERDVIAAMGDPMRLAASYTGRQLALIGPNAFPAWSRLLVLLLKIVVPIVGVLGSAAAVMDGESVGGVLFGFVGAAAAVAIQLGFWVTLVFALLERAGTFDPESDGAQIEGVEWTPDQLPAVPGEVRHARSEAIWGVVVAVVTFAFLVYQRLWFRVDGERLPILDPDLWSFWIPVMLVALAAQVVVMIVFAVRRKVSWALAWANLGLTVAFAGPLIWLAVNDQLWNPEFVGRYDWLSDNLRIANSLVVVGALTEGWDVFDKFRRARQEDRADS